MRIASVNAWHTGRAVARITAVASTQNREWSSTPVTILTSAPLVRNALAVTSSCHSSIGVARSQRRYSLRLRRRDFGSISPLRTRVR